MQGKKVAGTIILLIGLALLVISVLADPLGIGGYAGFGLHQIGGTIVGAVLLVAGLVLVFKK